MLDNDCPVTAGMTDKILEVGSFEVMPFIELGRYSPSPGDMVISSVIVIF